MSKADATLRHENFKRAIDRAGGQAKTPFQRAEVGLFDELGTWLHEVHNDTCNGITEAREAKDGLDIHIEKDKARRKGVKWFVGIASGIVVLIGAAAALVNLFCK